MKYKFENLEVWKLALKMNSIVYKVSDSLPANERYNLSSQLKRASTSVALNIAEGSTGQSNAEQSRFLSYAIRSCIEVIACIRLAEDRGYIGIDTEVRNEFEKTGQILFAKLQAFKKALN